MREGVCYKRCMRDVRDMDAGDDETTFQTRAERVGVDGQDWAGVADEPACAVATGLPGLCSCAGNAGGGCGEAAPEVRDDAAAHAAGGGVFSSDTGTDAGGGDAAGESVDPACGADGGEVAEGVCGADDRVAGFGQDDLVQATWGDAAFERYAAHDFV